MATNRAITGAASLIQAEYDRVRDHPRRGRRTRVRSLELPARPGPCHRRAPSATGAPAGAPGAAARRGRGARALATGRTPPRAAHRGGARGDRRHPRRARLRSTSRSSPGPPTSPPPSRPLAHGLTLPLPRQDVDELAAAALAELHDAVGLGEQRVVAAAADVVARVELRAALAHDDRARGDHLTAAAPSRRAAARSSRARCGRTRRPSSSTSSDSSSFRA